MLNFNFAKRWENLSEFLETFDFVPILLLATVYHYFEALGRVGDPFIIAAAIAIVVDLSHYRSVREAVRSHRWQWYTAAVFTTTLSFLLQYAFYNDGLTSIRLEPIVYAAVAPSLIFLAAWRGQELRAMRQSDQLAHTRRHHSHRRARTALRALRQKLDSLSNAMNTAATARTAAVLRADEAESRANEAESRADAATNDANALEARVNDLEQKLTRAKLAIRQAELEARGFRTALDDTDRAIVLNHITGELTQRALADQLGLSPSTVSDRKQRLNLNGAVR